MDEKLVVGSEFDVSGLVRGLNVSAAKLTDFQKQVNQLAKALPNVDPKDFMSNIRAGINDGIEDLNKAEAATGKLANRFEAGRVGGRRLESALTGMALAAGGLTGPLGRIVEGLVMFGAASLPLLELAASIGVVVAAYQLLTKSAREARDAQKEILKEQAKRQLGVGDPGQVQHGLIADQQRILTLRQEIAKWQKIANEDALLGHPLYTQTLHIHKLQTEEMKLQLAYAVDLQNLAQQRINSEIAVLNFQKQATAARISDLTAAVNPEIRTDTPAVRRERAAMMKAELKIMNDQHASLRDRNEAAAAYNALQQAALAPLHRANALVKEGAEFHERIVQAQKDFLTALQQTNAASRAALMAAPGNDRIKGLVTQSEGRTAPGVQATIRGQEQIDRAFSNTERAVGQVLVVFGDLDRHLIQTNGFWRKATREVEDHRTAAEKTADVLFHVGDTARGIGSAAQALGILSQGAEDALQSVAALADALGNLKLNPGSFSGILGVASAGIGILGSLFGKSANEREREQLLRQNNDRLAELRVALLDNSQQLAAARGILGGVSNPLQVQHLGKVTGLSTSDEATAALKQAGISLQEFAAIVKANTGLDILDSEGRLVRDAWNQARIAIDLYTEAQKRQAAAMALEEAARIMEAARLQTIAELQQRQADAIQASIDATNAFFQAVPTLLGLQAQLQGNADDPMVKFQNELRTLAQLLPHMVAQFQDFNLADPASRDALKQKLLDMIQQLLAGSTFGGDVGLQGSPEYQAFLTFLQQAIGGLDDFNQSVSKVTTNLPTGINLQAFEFAAQAAGSGTSASKPGTGPGTVTFPGTGPGIHATDKMDELMAVLTKKGIIRDVTVQLTVPADADPAEIVRLVKKALELEQMATDGTPDWRG